MGKRRRSGFGIGSLLFWFKPCSYVLSIPGYLDDGASWVTLFRLLYNRMTLLDWGLIGAGTVCAAMVFWPEKQRATRKAEPDTEPGLPEPGLPEPPPITPEPRTVTPSTPTPPQPITTPDPNMWITQAEALVVVRASSLVRLRLPQETMTLAEALLRMKNFVSSPTGRGRRADEISRHLLRKFKRECAWGVRSGTYDSELLREWIDQEAYREDPPTGYRAKQ